MSRAESQTVSPVTSRWWAFEPLRLRLGSALVPSETAYSTGGADAGGWG